MVLEFKMVEAKSKKIPRPVEFPADATEALLKQYTQRKGYRHRHRTIP